MTQLEPQSKHLALADRYARDAKQARETVEAMTIEGSDESLQWASDTAKQIRTIKCEVKGELDAICKPLRALVKTHGDRFKPAIEDLDAAERYLKREIQRCLDERAEAQRKALTEAKTAEELERTVALVTKSTKPAGFSERTTWDAEIVDPSKVPAEYLVIDEAAIKRDVRAAKGKIEIPGVRVIERKIAGLR